jgi:hypothetical protein
MSGEYEVTVDVTRLDATPNPAPLDAELNLEARERGARRPVASDVLMFFPRALASPRLASPSSRTPSQPTHPRAFLSSQIDYTTSADIPGAKWEIRYVVDMAANRYVIAVRRQPSRPSSILSLVRPVWFCSKKHPTSVVVGPPPSSRRAPRRHERF